MTTASRKTHLFIVLMIVVTALTWALGLLDIKYRINSDVAFADGFPGDISLWERAGDWSNVEVDSDHIAVRRDTENRSYAKRRFELPATLNRSAEKLRISGTIQALGHVDTTTDDRGAAYMVWLEDSSGEVVRYLTVQSLTDPLTEYHAERIVSIPDTVSAFTLVLNSRDSDIGYSLTAASAELISVTPIYRFGSALLICSWIAILLIGGKWLYQKASPAVFIIASALVVIILIGIMLPESATIGFVNPVFDAIARRIPAFNFEDVKASYKIGHFLFFLLISLVLARNARSLPIPKLTLLFLILLLAVATEGMQLHLFNRTTRITDVGIDVAGILLGWSLGRLWASTVRRRR